MQTQGFGPSDAEGLMDEAASVRESLACGAG
jgi:hypothetical protein